MGAVNHLQLTITGGRKQLPTEEWQFGMNFRPHLGDVQAEVETITGNDFDASYTVGTATGTGYAGTNNFLLEGGITDINPLDWLVGSVWPALVTYIGGTSFPPDVYIKSAEVWPIGNDGKNVMTVAGASKAMIEASVNTFDGGATAGSVFQPFTSFAVSTKSISSLPRGRGRFYPPPFMASFGANETGIPTNASLDSQATAAKTLLEAWQWTAVDASASIWPVIIGAPYEMAFKIVRVEMGSIADTQRRRKAQLVETYRGTAVSY